MRCYLAMTKKAILLFETTWMELEDIMLSKISHAEKDKFTGFYHTWNLRNKTNEQSKKRERETNTLSYREQTDDYQRGGGRGNR